MHGLVFNYDKAHCYVTQDPYQEYDHLSEASASLALIELSDN